MIWGRIILWIEDMYNPFEVVIQFFKLIFEHFPEHADSFSLRSRDFSDDIFRVCADAFGDIESEHFEVFIFKRFSEVPK